MSDLLYFRNETSFRYYAERSLNICPKHKIPIFMLFTFSAHSAPTKPLNRPEEKKENYIPAKWCFLEPFFEPIFLMFRKDYLIVLAIE